MMLLRGKIFVNPLLKSVKMSTAAREISIPVPWGEIVGKEWGRVDGEPWICLHGWLDNCGSFDRIVPYFPKEKRLICIDIPGHGFSSHYPKGMVYSLIDGVGSVQRVANHYRFNKFNLMGHSMGGGISMIYTSLFPEKVLKLVMLEQVKPMSREADVVVERTRDALEDLFAIEPKLENQKVYPTYEEAYRRQCEGVAQVIQEEDGMEKEALECLAKRSIKKVEGGFAFTRDLRHRIGGFYGFTTDLLAEFAKEIKCPHLVVLASRRQQYEPKDLSQRISDVYKRSNPENYMSEVVEGNHNVHMNNPGSVWSVIETFLAKHPPNCKL